VQPADSLRRMGFLMEQTFSRSASNPTPGAHISTCWHHTLADHALNISQDIDDAAGAPRQGCTSVSEAMGDPYRALDAGESQWCALRLFFQFERG
jgi:hypothetical protein